MSNVCLTVQYQKFWLSSSQGKEIAFLNKQNKINNK